MTSMIKTLIWQLRQFFVPFPDVGSWAYDFKTWLYYDRHIPPTTDTEPDPVVIKITGLSLPADLNTIEFPPLKWVHGKQNIPQNLYEQEVLSSMMDASNAMAEVMRKFGLSINEVTISIKQAKEAFDDHDANIPEGWEPIYVFPDDDNTLIGLVDPDGRVRDRRDIIPIDDPDDPDSV